MPVNAVHSHSVAQVQKRRRRMTASVAGQGRASRDPIETSRTPRVSQRTPGGGTLKSSRTPIGKPECEYERNNGKNHQWTEDVDRKVDGKVLACEDAEQAAEDRPRSSGVGDRGTGDPTSVEAEHRETRCSTEDPLDERRAQERHPEREGADKGRT